MGEVQKYDEKFPWEKEFGVTKQQGDILVDWYANGLGQHFEVEGIAAVIELCKKSEQGVTARNLSWIGGLHLLARRASLRPEALPLIRGVLRSAFYGKHHGHFLHGLTIVDLTDAEKKTLQAWFEYRRQYGRDVPEEDDHNKIEYTKWCRHFGGVESEKLNWMVTLNRMLHRIESEDIPVVTHLLKDLRLL